MTDSTHTPGPWGLSKTEWASHAVLADDDVEVCFVCAGEHDAETELANARLIAAAPDMLAALRAMVTAEKYGTTATHDSAMMAVRDALAKAEGES